MGGNHLITYTITVTNNGPNTANTVVATDNLPTNLTVNSYNASTGTTWTAPNWTIGNLNNGSSAVLTIVEKIPAAYSGTLNNTALVSSPTGDPVPANNTSTVNTDVTALSGPAPVNDIATTNINTPVDINVLANDVAGASPIVNTSVTFEGTLPNPTTQGVFSFNPETHLVTFTPATGFIGTVTVTYKIKDENELTGQATITITILKADLVITKTAELSVVNTVQLVTYKITVTNNGPDEAKAVSVTDNFPTGLTVNSAVPSVGSWSAPTWAVGNLANGANASLTIVAKVGTESTGTITNTATVTSTTGDPVLTNNSATATTTSYSGPRAIDDNATTTLNTAMPITVLTNDTPGSSPIVVTSVTLVAGTEPDVTTGVFTVNSTTGVVTFTPANGFTGTATIKYQILDGNGLASQATITVTVTPSLINNFPAAGYGTLAFEDLWPAKGDYDFNDLVLDYKFEISTNIFNYVDKVKATFVIKAFGASLENGFGFQLPGIKNAADLAVTGYSLTDGYIKLDNNGTETGQAKPTIIVYDNAFKQMTHPGVGIGVNTDPTAPYVAPKTIEVTITFKPNTYSYSDLDISNFNPFLIVNKVRGVEVHLPNYAPTSLVNQSLFGTVDDKSDPSKSSYYKTANNLPWAINIYEKFDYPKEKIDIIQTYLHFAEWATSGGTLFPDWYKNLPGYRNAASIYTVPQ